VILTVGVTRAALLQPNFSKIVLPKSIMTKVTAPVAEEKLPMNILYSFGLGNAALNY